MSESTPPAESEYPPPRVADETVEVRVRRAPKYGVFIAFGAVLGVVVAAVLTLAFDRETVEVSQSGVQYSLTQVFGFVSLICVSLGLVVGALAALVFDRRSRRRARTVEADRETVIEHPAAVDEVGAVDSAAEESEGAEDARVGDPVTDAEATTSASRDAPGHADTAQVTGAAPVSDADGHRG